MTVSSIVLDHPLVIGSGVAGLSVALRLPEATVLASGAGSTSRARGGIAAAVGPDDTPRLHARDTLAAGAGLGVEHSVEILCEGGPDAIQRLLSLGARFDSDPNGTLRLGLEAGHRRRRIVAADGDAIGKELVRTLLGAAQQKDSLHLREGWTAFDLLHCGSGVAGVAAVGPGGERVDIVSRGVVLATGGLGYLYLRTTNPPDVNGTGLAMAARAGARLVDLEFVQFHPTALDVGTDPMPLLTEALRGEGAAVVDEAGDRFLAEHHPDAELAPRDVVARAIWDHCRLGHRAYLDARHIPDVTARFPTVTSDAAGFGLDPGSDLLPVSPAAHYLMGGIAVDIDGRTNLPNLWAVGEAARTGVHGANRLASNSLLEGLVYATRVASDVTGHSTRPATPAPGQAGEPRLEAPSEMQELRTLMWEKVGLVRTRRGLDEAAGRLADLAPALVETVPGRAAAEIAGRVIAAASARTRSVGAHFRSDFPLAEPRTVRPGGSVASPAVNRR